MTPQEIKTRIEKVLWRFPWDNYGLDEIDIGLHDDPEAQEWIPDLAQHITDALT